MMVVWAAKFANLCHRCQALITLLLVRMSNSLPIFLAPGSEQWLAL